MKFFTHWLILLLFALAISPVTFAQGRKEKKVWSHDPFDQKVFIENKGQFPLCGEKGKIAGDKIRYGIRNKGVDIYFTASGVTFRRDEAIKLTEEQEEKLEAKNAGNRKKSKTSRFKNYFLYMEWLNANPNAEITQEQEVENYFTYADLKKNNGNSFLRANAFKKIIYKNIYPHIDIEYFFSENQEGIKYNVVLHPGANPGDIQMKYEGAKNIALDAEGNVVIASAFGKFIDHAPFVFEEGGGGINSSFVVRKNTVTFELQNYNANKKIVIDPWTTIPTFSGTNSAYDIDWDNLGNVYLLGGVWPFQEVKINNTGSIQWTFTCNSFTDLSDPMYGDFCVNRNCGTSFIGEGLSGSPGSHIIKVNNLGAQVALFVGDSRVNEISRMAYNSCTNTGVLGCGNTAQAYQAALFDTNLVSITPTNPLSTSESHHDITLLALDDTNCYMATNISLISTTSFNNSMFKLPTFTLMPPAYILSDGHTFGEYTSSSYVSGIRTSGFNGMAKDKNFLYTYDGATLKKWNPWNGALLASANTGGNMFLNGGLAIDGCGNLYLGSASSVLKYSPSLSLITSASTTGAVYDVSVGFNGEIYACGNAFVSSLNMNACPAGGGRIIVSANSVSLCQGTNATLTAAGGVNYSWNTGATTSSIVVHPTTTTNYTVIGTGLCVKDTNVITVHVGPPVNPTISANTTICSGATTTLTASGGASFVWSSGETTSSIVVSPAYSTTYSVTIANGACAATKTVNVGVSPTPIITSSSPSICLGNSVQLNTIYQLGCGAHNSTCSGSTSVSQIGTTLIYSNTTGATPFAALTTSAKLQYLYLASELSSGGMSQPMTIKEIGFNIQQLFGINPYQNFTIKVGCTGADSLTSAFTSGLSTVFNPKNAALATGVNYFVLDNAYDWDGVSNLVIEICFNNTTASQNSFAYYIPTAFNSVCSVSGASVCNNSTGTISKNRPTTYFKHCTSNAGAGFSYSWSPAATLNNSTIPNPIATPTSTTNYSLTVTDPVSTCVTICTASVSVGTPFTLSSTHDTSMCQLSGIQINTNPIGGNAPFSYSWTPSSSLNNPSVPNPVASPIATTTYVVTAVANGCTANDTVVIRVPHMYSFSLSPSADSICTGQSVQLVTTIHNACGVHSSTCASTNSVTVGTAATSSSAGNITVFVGANNSSRFQYLYQASELNSAGMVGSTTITQLGLNIAAIAGNNVYQNFTVNMGCTSLNSLSTNFTSGLQTVFNTKPLVIYTGLNFLTLDNNYDWDGVSNIVVEICFNNASSGGPNSTIYYSTTTFNSGLYYSSNTPACTNATGATVTTRPNTYFKYCAGSGLSTLAYNWTPSYGLSSTSLANPIATPSAITTYTVIAKDTVTGCIFSDSSKITTSPVFAVASTDGVVNCTTSGVQLYATPSPSGIYSYSWSPATSLSSTTIANPIASPSATTIYTVTITSSLGCKVSDTVQVKVNIPNLYSVDVIPNLDTICSGSSILLNTIIQKGCGTNGSVCGGPITMSQLGNATTYTSAAGISPFAGATNSAKYQFLYRAPELAAAGMNVPMTITQLGFNVQAIYGSNSYQAFTIKMGCTAVNTLSTSFISGLQTVYNSKPTGVINGINYIQFDNQYDWDGVSNLVVEICFLNSVTSQNSSVYYSNGTYNSVVYTTGASMCSATTGTNGINRPNTYFKHCGALGGNAFSYLWSPATNLSSATSPNPQASPTITTTYSLTITDTTSGCVMRDTAKIRVLGATANPIYLGKDTTLCYGNTLTLNAGSGFTSYLWSTGATTSVIPVSAGGTYWVRGNNMCGNSMDTIVVSYYPASSLSLGPDVNICAGNSTTLTATAAGFTDFIWSTGATTSSIVVNTTGNYWISSTNNCVTKYDTVHVTVTNPPVISFGNDTILCVGSNLTLDAGSGYNYQWSTGNTTQIQVVSSPGNYSVTVTNFCGTASDSIHVNYYPVNSLSLGPDISFCSGNSATITATVSGFSNYVWSTGATTSSIVVNTSGNYWIFSSNKCGSASDTVKVTVVNFPTTWLGNDTTLCAGRNWILDAGSGYAYQWSTGSTNQTITVSLAGTYSVTVSNACGASSDLINISYYPVNSLALGPDIHICTGNSATITATISGFTNYVWNTGATTSSIVVSTAGNYWISSSNKCGSAADTIGVFIDYAPFTSLGNDTILCVGHTLTLDAGSGYSYQWSTGDTSQTIVVSSPDVYVVVVTNACGSAFDQVNITYYPPNLLALGKDTAICPGDSVLEAITSSGFTNFIWNTGQTTTSIIVHQPGSYWVTSSNICGFGADTVNISVINLPTVNLGHDISTCVAVTLTLVATNASQYSWSTGETTISITANPPGIYWVQVSNQCGSAKDTVAVDQGTDPVFTLGKDTAMCNPYLTFNLSGVGTGYAWQDNSTQPTYTISSTGEYWVTVTNAEGCVSSDTINVSSAECPCNVDVPNAFSPNDDGINDIFWVRGYCDKFLLRIYDRWGELVFETSDVTVGWDGTFKGEKMNSGIFNYYLISYPVNADKRVKKGNVSLIR